MGRNKRPRSPKKPLNSRVPPKFERLVLKRLYRGNLAAGVAPKEIRMFFERGGYKLDASTYRRYARVPDADKLFNGTGETTGRPRKLTEKQERLLVGFVLAQMYEREEVGLSEMQTFVRDKLGVDLALATVSDYCRRLDITLKTVELRTAGFKMTDQDLVEEHGSFVRKGRSAGFLRKKVKSGRRVLSMDATYTSHRTRRRRSFSPKGSGKLKSKAKITSHTNTILTGLWDDGKNRTPCVLFTTNRAFQLDNLSSPLRKKQHAYLMEKLAEYGIAKHRIVFVGNASGKNSTYTGEKSEFVDKFAEMYSNEIPAGTVVLSDGGNAFKGDSFTSKGLIHRHYTACVHQFLSPNDNMHHGSGKRSWNTKYTDFTDDVDTTLYLMKRLDEDAVANSKKYFDRNLFFDGRPVTEAEVVKVIKGGAHVKLGYWRQCYREYCGEILGLSTNIPRGVSLLFSDFDGGYWQ